MSKRRFADLLHCEAAALAESAYEVDAGNAAGEIAHLALARLFATPSGALARAHLDQARRRLHPLRQPESTLCAWFGAQDPDAVDGIRAVAVSSVAGLLEVWPDMTDQWLPVPEQELKVGFGRVTIGGGVDLGLFPHRRRRDTAHLRSRVLLDWKVGVRWPNHDGDVLLYALLQLLRFAPRPGWSAPDTSRPATSTSSNSMTTI